MPTEAPKPTAAPAAAVAKPGTVVHFASAKSGFGFDYPGEWVPIQPKNQLVVADALADDVRLGLPDGPWLLVRATVVDDQSYLQDEIQMTQLAANPSKLKLVAAKSFSEPPLSGTDLLVEFDRAGATIQSRQIVLIRQPNQMRVAFEAEKGPMARSAAGLELVLTSLKAPGMPSFEGSELHWVEAQLPAS